MKKALTISVIPVLAFFMLGAFFAFPANAQTSAPTESCTLVRDVKIEFGTKSVVDEGSIVASTTGDTTATSDGTSITGDDEKALVKKWGTVCLLNTVNTVVDWIFIFLIAVSVALIAIAGFIYMTASANPEKQGMAGKMIMGAVIGIVIAILARVLPALITGILS